MSLRTRRRPVANQGVFRNRRGRASKEGHSQDTLSGDVVGCRSELGEVTMYDLVLPDLEGRRLWCSIVVHYSGTVAQLSRVESRSANLRVVDDPLSLTRR
jgi:hypothetical protein